MTTARANFCLYFFGCAGFDIVQSGSDADLIILCSSDSEYVPFAQEQLKAAGVQVLVHAQSDAVVTFTEWQDRLGV